MKPGWRQLPRELLERLRYQSHSGQLIRRHRALRRLEFRTASVLHPFVLLAGSYGLLLLGTEALGQFWFDVVQYWLVRLDYTAPIARGPTLFLAGLSFEHPYPMVSGSLPDAHTLGQIALIAVGAMLVSYLVLRRRYLPLAYLVWGVALVQLLACGFLWQWPTRYRHTLDAHVAGGFEMVWVLLYCVPVLLSFSFYAFDHGLLKKALGTAVILAGLVLVAPYQYLAHFVLVDRFTLAVLPTLFVMFGLLFDVAVFVALYAWVVSWDP